MIDERTKLNNWEVIIKKYIDELGDQDKSEEYLGDLISKFCFEKGMTGTTDNYSEQKELANEIKKLEKVKLTAKNTNKLKEYYYSFVKRGWIENCDSALTQLENKQCFYNIWICRALSLGYAVHPATHVAKLTHSSSSGLSVLDKYHSINYKYITTSSLNDKPIDGAYPNAAVSKIVKFLMLQDDNIMLSEELKNGNSDPIKIFSDNTGELVSWMEVFQKNLNPSLKSDALAKQIYFPIENNYHLLSVIKSSSIAQSIFLNNFEKSFKKELEKIDKVKKKIAITIRYIKHQSTLPKFPLP
jgi:CRISPR-associated protein Csy1